MAFSASDLTVLRTFIAGVSSQKPPQVDSLPF
jgi:hypothetical protein